LERHPLERRSRTLWHLPLQTQGKQQDFEDGATQVIGENRLHAAQKRGPLITAPFFICKKSILLECNAERAENILNPIYLDSFDMGDLALECRHYNLIETETRRLLETSLRSGRLPKFAG